MAGGGRAGRADTLAAVQAGRAVTLGERSLAAGAGEGGRTPAPGHRRGGQRVPKTAGGQSCIMTWIDLLF